MNGFSRELEVDALLKGSGQRSVNFRDPLRAENGVAAKPAVAVALSLGTLPEWTLILEQDVDVALRPIEALTRGFRTPAHLAFAFGAAALLPLVGLLWWRGLVTFQRFQPHRPPSHPR